MPRAFSLALLIGVVLVAANYRILGNVHYEPLPETVLDVMEPPHPALSDRPGVIVVHGGGWVSGAKADMLPFCEPFLEHDFVVANVEYRLADAAPAPAAITDVLAAAKWFADNAARNKVDPKRIVIAGFSSGGQLALLAGMLPSPNAFGPTTRIAAILDFYGIADVAEQLDGSGKRDYAERWIPPGPGRMELARRLSPLTYARKDVPPVLAIHGDADDVVPYRQSVRLVTSLKQAGAKAELITVPGGKHGISDSQAAQLWPQIFKWLKKIKVL